MLTAERSGERNRLGVRDAPWPVLPFTGFELLVVGGVFYRMYRHADDFEAVVIGRERVCVMRRDGTAWAECAFQRYWARARLIHGSGYYPSRLSIGSHGRFAEIATGVNETRRQVLARQLGAALQRR